MQILSTDEARKRFASFQKQRNYKVMYSSVFGGIIDDPQLMFVPIDDHLVHRGDGVFEACRYTKNGIFALQPHVDRLFKSAEFIDLQMPWSKQELTDTIQAVADASNLESGQLRIYASRGPGDFSPNPYSTVGTQLYIMAAAFTKLPKKYYEQGASLKISHQGIKPGFYSRVKSCNYLPNVLLKKEAVDSGVDFIVNKNPDGHIAEGPTENILILNDKNELLAPKFDYTLRGTTLLTVMDIAKELKEKLGLTKIELKDFTEKDLLTAKEVMMIGTTLGVLPITTINGDSMGKVGPIAQALNNELEKLF